MLKMSLIPSETFTGGWSLSPSHFSVHVMCALSPEASGPSAGDTGLVGVSVEFLLSIRCIYFVRKRVKREERNTQDLLSRLMKLLKYLPHLSVRKLMAAQRDSISIIIGVLRFREGWGSPGGEKQSPPPLVSHCWPWASPPSRLAGYQHRLGSCDGWIPEKHP